MLAYFSERVHFERTSAILDSNPREPWGESKKASQGVGARLVLSSPPSTLMYKIAQRSPRNPSVPILLHLAHQRIMYVQFYFSEILWNLFATSFKLRNKRLHKFITSACRAGDKPRCHKNIISGGGTWLHDTDLLCVTPATSARPLPPISN